MNYLCIFFPNGLDSSVGIISHVLKKLVRFFIFEFVTRIVFILESFWGIFCLKKIKKCFVLILGRRVHNVHLANPSAPCPTMLKENGSFYPQMYRIIGKIWNLGQLSHQSETGKNQRYRIANCILVKSWFCLGQTWAWLLLLFRFL